MRSALRTARYLRSWAARAGAAQTAEVSIPFTEGDAPGAGTLYLPRRAGPHPAWVVLHGITVRGRRHPQLERFAQALASTPAVVLVPEIPEWTRLDLDPDRAIPTMGAALQTLRRHPAAREGRVGLIGFSFGAGQALVAASDPRVGGDVGAVVGFGGYCDLATTFRFMFTGRHAWKGRRYRSTPDPYGRWVVGLNFLTLVPGMSTRGPVVDALRELTTAAGRTLIPASDPRHEPLRRRLRTSLSNADRDVFDLIAPDPNRPLSDAGADLAAELARAAIRSTPATDPRPWLGGLEAPVRLVHGRADDLIPFTESLRLGEALGSRGSVRVTGLFAHTRTAPTRRWIGSVREGARFALELRRILDML